MASGPDIGNIQSGPLLRRAASWCASSRLGHIVRRHPVLIVVALVILQQVFTFWSRDLWWSDEVRQANVLQNLIEHGDWIALQLNGAPYPDKPPLYFWLLAALSWLFASDQPPVILFGLALTVIFFACAAYATSMMIDADRRIALLSATILVTGSYFLLLSHYARMDFLFAGFIALAWGCFYRGVRLPGANRWIVWGFAACAAATMTKGPFGFLLPLGAMTGFLLARGRLSRFLARDMAIGLAILLFAVLAWAAGIAWAESADYLRRLLTGQLVGRSLKNSGNPIGYLQYLALLPLLFLPWTLALVNLNWKHLRRSTIGRIRRTASLDPASDSAVFLWSAMLSGLLILSAVGEKHEYYLLPMLIALSLNCARFASTFTPRHSSAFWLAVAAALSIIAILLAIASRLLPYEVSTAGIVASSLVLVATSLLLVRVHRRPFHVGLVALALGQTLWANVFMLSVAPSLDRVMSPRSLVAAMQPYIDKGYAPASYALTGGTLAYHLDRPYFEADDGFLPWLEGQTNAVVATPLAAWNRLPEGARLEEASRIGLAGDVIVIAVKR